VDDRGPRWNKSAAQIESYLCRIMPELGLWEPLRPRAVSDLLADLNAQWLLSGGWSLDLLVGHETRSHGDTDVTILRADLDTVWHYLADWDLHVADPPGAGMLRPWTEGSDLDPHLHDVWCRRSKADPWCLQLMINDVESGEWVYRRDRRIRRSLESLAGRASTEAMRVLAPEIQLLYKSKDVRDKDKADFDRLQPHLIEDEEQWLLNALLLVSPEHPWIAVLTHRG
jgi:hypothetical protein